MEDGSVVHMYTFMLHVNCRARLLLLLAQVSKFNSQSLNSVKKEQSGCYNLSAPTTTHQQLLKAGRNDDFHSLSAPSQILNFQNFKTPDN